ncbi:uncharacterized protein LOC107038294 isoform X2 [Diachasma alloeum]|uniref:uncharacterized protein LOC107038294 isoform X2 n=1 Tax=Diachasma alloeum TaxID=454923 RepID=UPI00073835B8|nr:uncharacterized protein LOC107038294 isoform X2 [Diachasma alloeum]
MCIPSCHDFYSKESSLIPPESTESEMAPNAEEEMLAVKPWSLQPDKERLRPPTYNAEDYAIALRRWGRRPMTSVQDSQGTLPSTTSSSSGYVSGSGEMTLRQFTSVSELLNKLRADLRLAFPSFVQEFSSAPADGITLLLETLRGVQLVQSTPPSGQNGPRIGTRRAALDELGCVECLAACADRCADAPRLLAQAQPGLLALAVCLTSSLNRSRVLALQLLTKVCQTPSGHSAVSEAVSTLRLRYGEGGRFRFLAGALLAPRAAIALRVAGISFLNAFLTSASRTQTRLYIQAEACEAGLEPRVLQEWLTDVDGRSEDALMDLLKKEVLKWSQNCVDVDVLQKRLARAEETCSMLSNKVSLLQNQIEKLQMEKRNGYNMDDRKLKIMKNDKKTQRLSSNGEDEGISSSERSSSPEDLHQPKTIDNDNDKETTIDDVIEELRIIVKDAEEQDRMDHKSRKDPSQKAKLIKMKSKSKAVKDLLSNIDTKEIPVSYYVRDEQQILNDQAQYPSGVDGGSLKIVVKGPDVEEAIVPAILYPQPPRRSPPCLSTILATRQEDFLEHPAVYNLQDDEDGEEETLGDGSDSLLSASRLKYNSKNQENVQGLYPGKSGIQAKGFSQQEEENNDSKCKKTIRNFDASLKNGQDSCLMSKHLDVYHHFEPATKTSSSRYRTRDPERKKLLRRSVSHDILSSEHSSPLSRRSGSKVEGRIRKFESMNSFDNTSLKNFSRNLAGGSSQRKSNPENCRKIRRSESCHHVYNPVRRDSRAGSDSGLHYITDFDLEPVMTMRKPELAEGENQMTKSLDRIDEGLDTMVDIVIGESQRWTQGRVASERNSKGSRSCDKGKGRQTNSGKRGTGKEQGVKGNEGKHGHLKSDQLYGEFHPSGALRNDELYKERARWSAEGASHEMTSFEKIHNFANNNGPLITSFYQERGMSKFSVNEAGIFLPAGRPYDAFGLGKNRFNAGKYSGNPTVDEGLGGRRNSGSSAVKRGKVTDIISGLY